MNKNSLELYNETKTKSNMFHGVAFGFAFGNDCDATPLRYVASRKLPWKVT